LLEIYSGVTVPKTIEIIYIFIHHQDGSTVKIRRLNKIYNLTKKQRMKQSSPNAHAMRYINRLAREEKHTDSR